MKKRNTNSGFSVLEIISVLVILAVMAAAAAATLAPIHGPANDEEMIEEIAFLNSLSRDFAAEHGRHPRNVNDLVRSGYLPISGHSGADRIRRIRRIYQYAPATGVFSRQ